MERRNLHREIPPGNLSPVRAQVLYTMPFQINGLASYQKVGNEAKVLVTNPVSRDIPNASSVWNRTSSIHGRSFEQGNIKTQTPLKNRLQIVRPLTNGFPDARPQIYASRSLKGADLRLPVMGPHMSNIGVIYNGLMERQYYEHMTKVSEFFFNKGIPAELIESAYLLEEFPLKDREKNATLSEFKEYFRELTYDLIDNYGVRLTKQQVDAHLQDVEFVAVQRLTSVGERIQDLRMVDSTEEFNETMQRILTFINEREIIDQQSNPLHIPTQFVLEKETTEQTFKNYLQYLGKRVGKNMARTHFEGVALVNGTAHNITAAGDFCDLESVSGERFGNKKITQQMEIEDIRNILFGKEDIIQQNQTPTNIGIAQVIHELIETALPSFNTSAESLFSEFAKTFLQSYAEERFTPLGSAPQGKGKIGWLVPLFQSSVFTDLQKLWVLNTGVMPEVVHELNLVNSLPTNKNKAISDERNRVFEAIIQEYDEMYKVNPNPTFIKQIQDVMLSGSRMLLGDLPDKFINSEDFSRLYGSLTDERSNTIYRALQNYLRRYFPKAS